MGALAIGMSSNVMAVKLVVAPSPTDPNDDVQHKSNPIAFEVTEGEITATALLLIPKKGEINGLICFTNPQINLGDDCSRVTGKMSQYDGINQIELTGTGIKQAKINQTKALIYFPMVADASAPYRMFVTSTTGVDTVIRGLATQFSLKYKNRNFITSNAIVHYQTSRLTSGFYPDIDPPICQQNSNRNC